MAPRTQPGTALLLGNYRPTLIVARELRQLGYKTICGHDGCDRGAELSRFVDEIFDHPPIKQDRAGCIASIAELAACDPEITCIYPISEEYVRLFSEAPPVLPKRVKVVIVPPRLIKRCLDKKHMMRLAEELKVPIAPFSEVTDLDSLLREAVEIGFPIVMRPADSVKRLFGEKAITVHTNNELLVRFEKWPDDQDSILIQKKANGIRHNFYFAAVNGKIKRRLHAIITRTDRIDGSGLAVDGVTTKPDPALAAYTASLVEALNYSGVGCAQFLVDDKGGEVCFLEINPRIAGNHAVPEHCGLGLGQFLHDFCQGMDLRNEPMLSGRPGVRYSWLAGDIEGLKASWKRGDLNGASVGQWIGCLWQTWWKSDIDMMLSRKDVLPGLATLCDAIPGIGHLSRLRHRFKLFVKPRAAHPTSRSAALPVAGDTEQP